MYFIQQLVVLFVDQCKLVKDHNLVLHEQGWSKCVTRIEITVIYLIMIMTLVLWYVLGSKDIQDTQT